MSTDHHVIIVPGLGDTTGLIKWSTKQWINLGITPHVHIAPWKSRDETFNDKLNRLIEKIDSLTKEGKIVSLIGISAGGSLVLNAYANRKEKIHKVINICGRLTEGVNVFPSLRLASRKNDAFYRSVVFSEKNIQNFTSSDYSKLLTLTSVIDELVPPKTSIIKGASNKRIPMIGHMLSITFATIAMRTMIINFLKPPN